VWLLALIALHVAVLLLLGRLTHGAAAAYTVLCAVTLPLLAALPASPPGLLLQIANLPASAVPVVVQLRALLLHNARLAARPAVAAVAACAGGLGVLALLNAAGEVRPAAPGFLAVLGLSPAEPHVASLEGHQPAAWSSFFLGLHALVFMLPLGVDVCLRLPPSPPRLFLILYAAASVYMAATSRHMMFLLAPAACALGAIAVVRLATQHAEAHRIATTQHAEDARKKKRKAAGTASSSAVRDHAACIPALFACIPTLLAYLSAN